MLKIKPGHNFTVSAAAIAAVFVVAAIIEQFLAQPRTPAI